VEELIHQIQQQFNVMNQMDESAEQSIFHSVDTPKAAKRAFLSGKIALIPLCKYVYGCYRENKHGRNWKVLPVAAVAGIYELGCSWYLLFAPDSPWAGYMLHIQQDAGLLACLILGILLSGVVWFYESVKLFWLYYLTPVYGKCERNPKLTIVNDIVYLLASVLAAGVIPVMFVAALLMLNALAEGMGSMADYMQP